MQVRRHVKAVAIGQRTRVLLITVLTKLYTRADGFYHPFVPTPGPLRYRAISPDTASSYVGAVTVACSLTQRFCRTAQH